MDKCLTFDLGETYFTWVLLKRFHNVNAAGESDANADDMLMLLPLWWYCWCCADADADAIFDQIKDQVKPHHQLWKFGGLLQSPGIDWGTWNIRNEDDEEDDHDGHGGDGDDDGDDDDDETEHLLILLEIEAQAPEVEPSSS